MKFLTHVLFATLVSTQLYPGFADSLFLVIAFSLIPDIDEKNSFISRRLPIPLSLFFRHRGVLHGLPAGIFSALLLLPLGTWVSVAALAGFGSHLVLDSLTREGIRPLAPFSKFRIRGVLRTGGLAELLLQVLIALLILHWTLDILS